MKNKITSITIILTILILLPALFFSTYEIARFTKNEKEIEDTYNKQLDAILFSINLYSEDIFNSWATKISANESVALNSNCNAYQELLSNATQIKSICYFDYLTLKKILCCSVDSQYNEKQSLDLIQKLFSDSTKKIERLAKYLKAGYRKIEQLGRNTDNQSLYVVFMSKNKNRKDSLLICTLEVNEVKFIKELLWQKIQVTSEERFNIGIIDSKTAKLINPGNDQSTNRNFQIKKPLWIFPRYLMGIQLKGKTIDTITKERTRSNLLLIIFADIIFILGALFVFRNVRREMKLTIIKSDFISNVSHEIRTPLALISMYIETLEMDRVKSEEKKKEYYRVIFNETQRLSGLVNKILNFSKIESGKRKFVFEKVNLNEIVEHVLQSYKFHLRNKEFELDLELDNELPLIKADKEAISESIVNLIDNAIKYSRDLKFVGIKTLKQNNFIVFEISDKGIGITKTDQRFVFDKFFRVSKGDNVHDVKGTGLGLTIVKNIVDAHKGRVEVESKPGEGSIFKIFFPIEDV